MSQFHSAGQFFILVHFTIASDLASFEASLHFDFIRRSIGIQFQIRATTSATRNFSFFWQSQSSSGLDFYTRYLQDQCYSDNYRCWAGIKSQLSWRISVWASVKLA